MLRRALLAASASKRIHQVVMTAPFTRDVVARFVAGDTADDALRVTQRLQAAGLLVTLDYLGEDTVDPEQAAAVTAEYVRLLGRLGGGRGHRTLAGTPEQIADTIEHWGGRGAADGFNIMPAALPSGFELFAEHVVPILRQRGLIRREYEGTTLREHYGLPRPPSRYASSAVPAAPAANAGARVA